MIQSTALQRLQRTCKIDNPDAESLYEYVENNCSKTQYTGVEKVLYLAEMSKKLSDEKASFEYSFEAGTRKTADISDGHCEVIKIPSTKIDTLKILKVNGDIDVLSLYTAPYTDAAENDPHITVSRKYLMPQQGKRQIHLNLMTLLKLKYITI